MAEQPYKEPPITEAVIEIRFATNIEANDIAKVSGNLKSHYPLQHAITDVMVQLNLPSNRQPAPTTHSVETHGSRVSTDDQTQLALIWPHMFVWSQLAPYPGWDAFFERFCRDWGVCKRTLGYRRVSRVGVRYINRIDIPATTIVVEHEDYLNVYPHVPSIFPTLMSYNMLVQLPLPDIGCTITLNSSSAPSPLLGHAAFVIDQDIFKDNDLPQADEAIYALLSQMRVKKNEVFEACITPRARELFKPCQA